MKTLSCKGVGMDCDFIAKGRTADEVLKKAAEHAKKDHGLKKVTKDYLKSWSKHIQNE